jgi:hypothetical protein
MKTCYDFANGKLVINERPGNGCEPDLTKLERMAEYTEAYNPIPMRRRPDGAYANW